MNTNLRGLWLALLIGSAVICRAAETDGGLRSSPDRSHWPAALRNVPVDRLSSGALLRLDANGDLVELPTDRARRTQDSLRQTQDAPAVALDPRVGANIRLGDDPAALPPNMRAQAEPHIARSPVDSNYLIATFQEGRFTDGSAVNCGYSVSLDGGIVWSRELIPGTTPSSGGPYPRLTDPVAARFLHWERLSQHAGCRCFQQWRDNPGEPLHRWEYFRAAESGVPSFRERFPG